MRSSAPDTDLEVTVSEVRPDGTEVYVQSGWLRASHRRLDHAERTPISPVHTDLAADARPLPAGKFTRLRVGLFPFAQPFRAGSRIRITVDAPGGARPLWAFDTISDGERVTVATDRVHQSRLVLPVVAGRARAAQGPAVRVAAQPALPDLPVGQEAVSTGSAGAASGGTAVPGRSARRNRPVRSRPSRAWAHRRPPPGGR